MDGRYVWYDRYDGFDRYGIGREHSEAPHANEPRLVWRLFYRRQVERVSVQGVRGQSPRIN